jgi:hypothetical protein
MKKRICYVGTNFCLLLFLFNLFGCAHSPGVRFYSGEALPQKQVAFIYLANKCQLGAVTREGHNRMELFAWNSIDGEIIPGNYILELRYFNSGTYSKVKGDTVNFPLRAEAGHVYYIAAEFGSSTWHPNVIDITSSEDYNKITNGNPKHVKDKIVKYFQGERVPLQETEVHFYGGGVRKMWR